MNIFSCTAFEKISLIFRKHEEAISATFWNLLGTFLPIIIGYLLTILFKSPNKLTKFIDGGDICLFSAALLTSSAYLFITYSRNKTRRITMQSFLFAICVLMIFISAIIYGGIYTNQLIYIEGLNIEFIRIISVIFILIAIIFFYYAQYLDNPPNVDAQKREQKNIDDLEQQYNNLS